MNTYLWTWNPNTTGFPKLQTYIKKIRKTGQCADDWSTGRNKRISPEDRFFLLRQGKEPKGIIASGKFTSTVWLGDHWNKPGKKALYADILFDVLSDAEAGDPIVPRGELDEGILGRMFWDTQASGTTIPPDVAEELTKRWAALHRGKHFESAMTEASAIEGARIETRRYVQGRSRKLCEIALFNAGGRCSVCEFDFSTLLNGNGVRVLQVHHKKQLAESDAPRVTYLQDLAVVCANCHALIHTDPKRALKVESLKRMLAASKKVP